MQICSAVLQLTAGDHRYFDAMTDTLAIALAQLNPTVGDIDGNVAKIRKAAPRRRLGADLVIFASSMSAAIRRRTWC